MSLLDKLKDRAIKNSHSGGVFSSGCAVAINKLEQKRMERKYNKLVMEEKADAKG